ncbi:MAG: serine/threonine-protein kinase [Deltaproteobacteria bacterium]
MPPKRIGPYQIEATLGRGGIGTVYRARDRRTGEPVALKLLTTGPALHPTAALRLAREFETLSSLSHPNVVRVFDTGVHEGYPYLAMELIDGLDLRAWLAVDLSAGSGETFRDLLTSSQEHASRADDEPWSEELSKPKTDLPRAPGPNGEAAPRPFDVDRWASEPLTDDNFATPLSHGRGAGVEALRALALLVSEPDTEEGDSAERDPRIAPRDAPVHDAAREAAPPPDLALLNRPERIARLKDAAQQLARALAFIHARGLVHRDVKPANVLVTEDRHVKLMDFGLAKFLAAESAVTDVRRIVGTYRYMAPEQALGEKLDGRADLYSLGVMLYELLAGRPPYDAQTAQELWQKVMETEPPPLGAVNPGVDYTLALVVHRLLRKDPEDRYQTAEETFDALME